ncbi:MAG: ATP-binding protein [Ignavibacteriales bacterium]|nr:MAG: ATP-binding protein [Ignavibacteriaceae bacterium]MBW7871821.1 ATP-binding protein [Ignavibacteria bacterium]MCZ2144329.1 ATP-binding protein [Ignavibacteriales bacterium]OQY76404.1 MAG: hypothetical protein B6D45_03590 [Ignavibacteriales bacterium UTCHB3]MBV6446282.1 Serine-protein kinase RsbW [Ignavibacteriaceae bacterium]
MDLFKSIVIQNKIEETVAVADYVESTTRSVGFSDKEVYDILIALDEVLANITYYAYSEGTTGEIEIEVSFKDDVLQIKFIDSGVEFNPLAKKDPDLSVSIENRAVGGLGIYIVKKLMDSVTYSREGKKNIFIISKKLNGESNGN